MYMSPIERLVLLKIKKAGIFIECIPKLKAEPTNLDKLFEKELINLDGITYESELYLECRLSLTLKGHWSIFTCGS